MSKGFLYFSDEIINYDDIVRIHKCKRTNSKAGLTSRIEYGIRVAMRRTDDSYEWFGGDAHLRDDRFTTLHKILCNN